MENFFESIKTRILTEVPEVKNIELWNNQVQAALDGEISLNKMPAVFLGIEDMIEFQMHTDFEKTQEGNFVLSVHIVKQNIIDNIRKDRHTDWSILTLKQKIYKALEGWTPDESDQQLNRIHEDPNEGHGQFYDYVQSYNAVWLDCSLNEDSPRVEIPADTVDLIIAPSVIQTSKFRTYGNTENVGRGQDVDFDVNKEL
jgi:hypothetical protein